MSTTPILIVVAVTPRKDAVSAGAAVEPVVADPPDVAVAPVVAVVAGGAFFPLLPQATSVAATVSTTATVGGTRNRPTSPPPFDRDRTRPAGATVAGGPLGDRATGLFRGVLDRREGPPVAPLAERRVERDETERVVGVVLPGVERRVRDAEVDLAEAADRLHPRGVGEVRPRLGGDLLEQ